MSSLTLDSPEVNSFLSQPSQPMSVEELPETAISPNLQPNIANEQPKTAISSPLDSLEIDEFLAPELKAEKYGSLEQKGKTALEGIASGVAGPLAPAAEIASGISTPEDILARREVNPITHYGAEGLGLVLPALVTAGMSAEARAGLEGLNQVSQLGLLESAAKAIVPEAGTTLASKIGTAAAKGAVENALLAGSDEVSKLILQDPNQSAETAIMSVGLSGVLGGAVGGAIGGVSPLWQQVAGSRVGKLVEDFKGRVGEHVSGVSSPEGVHQELTKYYNDINDLIEGTRGPLGIKAQDIEKLVPKMSESMFDQVSDISQDLTKQVEKMAENPNVYPPRFVDKLQSHIDTFTDNISRPSLSSSDLFKETEDLKRIFQQYAKYEKAVSPLSPEYQFVQDAKSIAKDLKGKLEDSSVWGKAAERQKDFNAAVSSYLPKLKDFESKFTTKLADEGRVIDPAKVASFVRSIGKPNAEIRTSVLDKFFESTEEMKKEIGKIHTSLGVTDSIPESPLSMTKAALKDPTLGAQIADTLLGKVIGEGSGLGAAVGGIFGHKEGFGTLGALLGAHVLGPMFKSILPGIAGAIMRVTRMSAPGFKAAIDYASQVAKGQELLSKGAKSVFLESNRIITNELLTPSEEAKLERRLQSIKLNPQGFLDQQSHLNHYLPDHQMAVDQASSSIATYLSGLKPSVSRGAPLDSLPVPSSFAEAKYRNALTIAQKPEILFNRIKEGTITGEDLTHLGAMYPNMYRSMTQKLTDEMSKQLTKGKSIPYNTRMGLSIFLAQPMDSTLSPSSIMAAQQANAFPLSLPSQQAQMPQKGTKSSPALQKMSSLYQSPSQSREARRNKS